MTQVQHWGHKLGRLLIENKMTQSDLARKIWNEERADSRGYTHVVGKDRVSAYVNRGVVPEMWIVEDIAKLFKTEPEKLCPEAFTGRPANNAAPLMRIEAIPGNDYVLLKVNQIVAPTVAAEIFSILSRQEPAATVGKSSAKK